MTSYATDNAPPPGQPLPEAPTPPPPYRPAAAAATAGDAFNGLRLGPATPDDLDDLVAIEQAAFASDRLSRRSFRHLLSRGQARCILARVNDRAVGYALVLLRRGTSLARLYSIASLPESAGRGIGRALLAAAEAAALEAGCIAMRLEVRPDNGAAIRLYRRGGYREFGRFFDYYEDHAEALRFEKLLILGLTPRECRVPYYQQTTKFTCGPAAMMMAMAALDPGYALERTQELRLWREATTIFMTSGHGGCAPHAMAVALARRGFRPSLHLSFDGPLFLDTVRDPAKKEVMALIQADDQAQAEAFGVPVTRGRLGFAELAAGLDEGALAIVLISSYRLYGDRIPHWVLVHGHDERCVYVHDPWVEDEQEEFDAQVAKASLPIPRGEFDRVAAYGRTRLSAAIFVRRAEAAAP
ncbi:MAG TPA: peptidase C39 family protein [Geminicoccaceae bacterium]|nr:peptidase C39 family protein [Geminicoccaceae bacterium]